MKRSTSTSVRALRWLALSAALIMAACGPAPTYSAEDVATMVAATIEGLGELPHEMASASPESTSAAEPTATSVPTPVSLRVVYTDGGNVAYYAEPGPASLLTFSGAVESVRLSDDGEKIAYSRRPTPDGPPELRVVDRDGSGDGLLMSPSDFDALYPLGDALHHDLSQFDFLPGTHILLLNTRYAYEGPGLTKHDDLIQLDTDTLARTMLLAPGTGGDFTASPDGQYLAIVRPDTIEIRRANGTPTGSGTISYTPVITYSEYRYYARPVWAPDSSAIGAAIPSSDPLAPATTGSIWRLPVGGTASLLSTISGQFLLLSGSDKLLSPDLARVAYTKPTSTPNVHNLYWSFADGSGETLIATFRAWGGWSPDAQHFVFSLGDAFNLQLGDVAGGSDPLAMGTDLKWFGPTEFLFLSGSMGGWTLNRGSLGGPATALDSPTGDFVDYDFAYD